MAQEQARDASAALTYAFPRASLCAITKTQDDNTIRTRVSLNEEEHKLAKKEARALGISAAECVRRAIRQSLPPADGAPWMRYAGFVESGDPRSSESVDDVVYGAKD